MIHKSVLVTRTKKIHQIELLRRRKIQQEELQRKQRFHRISQSRKTIDGNIYLLNAVVL